MNKFFLHIINRLRKEFIYIIYGRKFYNNSFGIKLLTIDETLDYMSHFGHSIVRFGDGEFNLMNGGNIPEYQEFDKILSLRLKKLFYSSPSNLLVCLPEPMRTIRPFIRKSRIHWTNIFYNNSKMYSEILNHETIYGNSFVSRPYIIFADKTLSSKWFEKFLNIFVNKDIVIIEGEYSRSGVGNDMFSKAKTVKRILCPSKNSFRKYEQIRDAAMECSRTSLYLIALGPTGKLITEDLANDGRWALDIGHIDSEYEWYLRAAHSKVAIANKHTAEHIDSNIGECEEPEYLNSIIKRISINE